MRHGISAMRSALLEHCEAGFVVACADVVAQSVTNAENNLKEITAAVAAQNLSPDEVSRMNHERETLSRNLEELRGKLQQARKNCHHQEMEVTGTMDRLIELQQTYVSLGHEIGCLGPSCKPCFLPAQGGIDCSLDVELGSGDLAKMSLVGQSWNRVIHPALQSYRDDIRKEERALRDEKIALEDKQDRYAQEVEQRRAEAAGHEYRLKVTNDQAEAEKNVGRKSKVAVD